MLVLLPYTFLNLIPNATLPVSQSGLLSTQLEVSHSSTTASEANALNIIVADTASSAKHITGTVVLLCYVGAALVALAVAIIVYRSRLNTRDQNRSIKHTTINHRGGGAVSAAHVEGTEADQL